MAQSTYVRGGAGAVLAVSAFVVLWLCSNLTDDSAMILHKNFTVDIESTVAFMKNLVMNNTSGAKTEEWMIAAQSGPFRWSLPMERVFMDSSPLLQVPGRDTHINICRQNCCKGLEFCVNQTLMLRASAGAPLSTRPCQTTMEIAESLSHGAWKRNDDNSDEWTSPICALPKTLVPPTKQRRALFVGDSTMREIALMVALGAGSSLATNTMNCVCTKTNGATGCRIFDAVGPTLNTSMLWAGHVDCDGNRMGVQVANDEVWRSMIQTKVALMEPDFIFFHAPVLHSCQELKACAMALKRFLCFMTSLPSKKTVMIITAGGLTRSRCQGSKARACSFKLRAYEKRIQILAKIMAPQVQILNIFGPTESWKDLSSPQDPFKAPCYQMERHLLCDVTNVTNFQQAWEDTSMVSAPGRLIGAAVMHAISLFGDQKDIGESSSRVSQNIQQRHDNICRGHVVG